MYEQLTVHFVCNFFIILLRSFILLKWNERRVFDTQVIEGDRIRYGFCRIPFDRNPGRISSRLSIGGAVDNEGKSDEIEREGMLFINCSIITRTRISISYFHMLIKKWCWNKIGTIGIKNIYNNKLYSPQFIDSYLWDILYEILLP